MNHQVRRGRTVVLVLIVIIVGFALYLSYRLHSSLQNQPEPRLANTVSPAQQTEATPAATSYSLPVRLKIPKLNIDAVVSSAGLTPEGDMQAPSGPHEVSWYKFGALPGNTGTAVIAGHYGRWKNGEVSVFNDLHTLSKGDHLYVVDEKGASAAFVVGEQRAYNWNEKVTQVFQSTDEKSHLNLVTCQGDWNEGQQTYSRRLVIFANKVEDEHLSS